MTPSPARSTPLALPEEAVNEVSAGRWYGKANILGPDHWQSLYHFTVGGHVEDVRLTTLPPYAWQP